VLRSLRMPASRTDSIDTVNDETFRRIVGKRTQAHGPGVRQETVRALTEMAQYVTRAPKGVFRYQTHEQANLDRERWTVDAMQVRAELEK
jgi:hypothetical protein